VAGTTIIAADMNNVHTDIAAALTGSVARDGQSPLTANWNVGNFNITGIATLSATTLNVSGTATISTLTVTTFTPASVTASGNGTFGGTLSATGTVTGAGLIPSSSSVPSNGVFLPAANTVGIATNSAERLRINASGAIGIGGANYGTAGQILQSNGSGAAVSWVNAPAGYNPSGSASVPFIVRLPINSGANTIAIEAGSATTGAGGTVTITFSSSFASAPIVTLTAVGAGDTDYANLDSAPTASSCVAKAYNSSGVAQTGTVVNYIAIGVLT
jgi:hypothetical protein